MENRMKTLPTRILNLMKKYLLRIVLLASVFLFSGCTLLIIGGVAYYFIDGKLAADYHASFDKTWIAREKTIVDLHGLDVIEVKDAEKGKITTLISKEKIKFDIRCKSGDVTTVAISVGYIGNKKVSQMLHERINDHLASR